MEPHIGYIFFLVQGTGVLGEGAGVGFEHAPTLISPQLFNGGYFGCIFFFFGPYIGCIFFFFGQRISVASWEDRNRHGPLLGRQVKRKASPAWSKKEKRKKIMQMEKIIAKSVFPWRWYALELEQRTKDEMRHIHVATTPYRRYCFGSFVPHSQTCVHPTHLPLKTRTWELDLIFFVFFVFNYTF